MLEFKYKHLFNRFSINTLKREVKAMKQKALIFFILIMSVSLVFPGLVTAGKMWPATVDKMVARVIKSVQTVDMATFRSVVDKKGYDLIVDVREPKEYAAGHVPGALSIPRGVLEFMIWSKVGFPEKTDTGKKIYIYCKTGGRASLATKSLTDLGFIDVTAVIMKIDEWSKAGHPIEK